MSKYNLERGQASVLTTALADLNPIEEICAELNLPFGSLTKTISPRIWYLFCIDEVGAKEDDIVSVHRT
jgi:hypothetical protein